MHRLDVTDVPTITHGMAYTCCSVSKLTLRHVATAESVYQKLALHCTCHLAVSLGCVAYLETVSSYRRHGCVPSGATHLHRGVPDTDLLHMDATLSRMLPEPT